MRSFFCVTSDNGAACLTTDATVSLPNGIELHNSFDELKSAVPLPVCNSFDDQSTMPFPESGNLSFHRSSFLCCNSVALRSNMLYYCLNVFRFLCACISFSSSIKEVYVFNYSFIKISWLHFRSVG